MTTWHEQSLFLEEFQVVHLAMWNERADGWKLTTNGRRFCASWNPGETTVYDRLTRAELCDVVGAELVRFLEL